MRQAFRKMEGRWRRGGPDAAELDGKYEVGVRRSDVHTPGSDDCHPSRRTLRVISNFRRLDSIHTERFSVIHRFDADRGSIWSAVRLFFQAFEYDIVILNNDTRRLLVLCLLRWIWPFHSCRLVSVDLVLSRPRGWRRRLTAGVMKLLFRKVDLFVLYFVDLEAYNRFYGISPPRVSYVPFKVNSWDEIPLVDELSSDGEYVFTGGRSFRDLPTFIAAMRRLSFPGLLLYHNLSLMKEHGTHLDLSDLPSNLRAEEDNGDAESWLQYILKAKVVVLPTMASSISASGISAYVLAMACKKCVIITEGAATRGLLTDQAIIVPPADPIALAEAICLAWQDDDLRERTANAGRHYADRLGGEARLLSDIVDICGDLVQGEIPLYGEHGQPPPSNP